jgi:hypothetical protein
VLTTLNFFSFNQSLATDSKSAPTGTCKNIRNRFPHSLGNTAIKKIHGEQFHGQSKISMLNHQASSSWLDYPWSRLLFAKSHRKICSLGGTTIFQTTGV